MEIKSSKLKKLIMCVFSVLLSIIIFGLSVAPSFASGANEETTVRVGYMDIPGFLYKEDNGEYAGIAYDLLREIAVYNHWNYEFVETCYADSKEMLDDGKIDVFIPYQRDAEREKKYEYSNEVFCTNRASLLTLPNSKISYDDFEDMDGITIAAAKETRNDVRFSDFLKEKGCSVTIKNDYDTQDEMIEAMKKGEVDAVICASNRGIKDCKIVLSLDETKSFIVAKKGNREFLDKFDYAIEEINRDMPDLYSTLNDKYITPEEGAYPSFTIDETSYINSKKTISVLISASECDSNGNFYGSAKTIFDELSKVTGLEFKPLVKTSSTELLNDFSNGEGDIVYSFNHDYTWADKHNAWMTESYASFYNKVITRTSTSKIKTVAVVPGTYIEYYVKNNYNYNIIERESYEECINAVMSGDADATYCNSLIGNYYETFPKYRQLNFLSSFDFYGSYCMAVSKSSDSKLVSILNKSIECLPNSALLSAFETQISSKPTTLTDVFYSNLKLSIILVIVSVAVVVFAIFLIIYVVTTRKKNRELKIASNAKTDFLSRMSHDMRTPMNGILGLTQLSLDETDMSTIKHNLNQIGLSGKYLLSLINDTLDMNKIESGKLELHLKPINSEDVFCNVLSTAHILAEEKRVVLEIITPEISHENWVPVMADASRLEQVLINIISNAIKFTPPGNMVSLVMETVSIGDGVVRDKYVIRDTGIGMSEDFLPHVFDAFSQEARMNSKREEGTGLGMPIVKQLVDLMNSEISIKSELNKGTEVTLLMNYPIYEGKLEVVEDKVVSLEILEGKHFLVCEDHPLNAEIIVKLLQKHGINADVAENGKVGFEMFEKNDVGTYDLVLMDIRMPVMDGLSATRAIRQSQKADAKTIPIIAMTANAYDTDIENCLEAGMNAHLSKPIEINRLYQTIAKWLTK